MELVVTVGIFIVITSVALANYPQFSGRLALARIAREMALSIRQAQIYGVAVREFPKGSGEYPPYGIYFSKDEPKQFIFFGDSEGTTPNDSLLGNRRYDGTFDCPVSEECLEKIVLRGNEYIKDICLVRGSGLEECNPSGVRDVSILFRRPDPEALISNNVAKGEVGYTQYSAARIILTSERFPDKEKVIRVWLTGQISIE